MYSTGIPAYPINPALLAYAQQPWIFTHQAQLQSQSNSPQSQNNNSSHHLRSRHQPQVCISTHSHKRRTSTTAETQWSALFARSPIFFPRRFSCCAPFKEVLRIVLTIISSTVTAEKECHHPVATIAWGMMLTVGWHKAWLRGCSSSLRTMQ